MNVDTFRGGKLYYDPTAAPEVLPPTEIKLPTLHPKQVDAYTLAARFRAVRCGRRWGKTLLGTAAACSYALKGRYVGWFAPAFKFVAEAYREIDAALDPVKENASRDGVYSLRTGGRIDFWSMEDENAGRSRKYHLVVIDEAAFTKDGSLETWRRAIRPTLLDYRGQALVISNTNGIDPENLMWQLCNEPKHGFVDFHAPTSSNPHLPADEVAKLEADNHPLVYQQEYLAEFVDWSGAAFFAKDRMLVDGLPVAWPVKCDAVFAVLDTAIKTRTDNDGTGLVFYAYGRHGAAHPLVVLDWDLVQIEGSLLESWLPESLRRLEEMARVCGARAGSLGVFIEDKGSGTILLQQGARRGWPVQSIDSKLTSMGKDERAISVSGYHYRGMAKLSNVAHDKTTIYKGTTRNHLLGQVVGFRVGDKDPHREDDLLDCYCYGLAIALGDSGGF